jgi:hypothetical protein
MVSRAWLVACALGCGAPSRPPPLSATAPATDEVTLYRDRALVTQHVDVVAPSTAPIELTVVLAAGVGPGDLVVLGRDDLIVSELRIAEPPARPLVDAGDEPAEAPEAGDPRRAITEPTEVALTISAPRAGHFVLTLAYATERLAWDAAYTMTTTPARERAVLRGAVTIHNASGIGLRGRTYVVDGELGTWRDHAEAAFGSALREPLPRDLGFVELGDGETRIELLAGAQPHRMRSVLVYDPIGAVLDHPGSAPISDPAVGVTVPASTRVTESFEVDRDDRTARGLPAGPVRLLERHPDGSLAVLGESRLGGAASRVAGVDTVAIGTADAVVGHRERRDWGRDDVQKRFSEEFLITIDNARPRPVDLVIREHLYRGQNWTLAYQSAPAAKEGPQQISLRTTVPANGQAKVLYVVVYTW